MLAFVVGFVTGAAVSPIALVGAGVAIYRRLVGGSWRPRPPLQQEGVLMDVLQLQRALRSRGYDPGVPNGVYTAETKAAVLLALEDGPDTPLSSDDIANAATALRVTPAHIAAVVAVEAAGAGFVGGRPKILFEPHRFSKATKGRFDNIAPDVSYPRWDRTRYPKTQDGRYEQLVKAVGLDVDAGFGSASYGAFQIMGENFAACGWDSPFAFAFAMATSEADQLDAFIEFVKSKRLDDELRAGNWAGFARGYNGTAYRENRYDTKLAAAYVKAGGR